MSDKSVALMQTVVTRHPIFDDKMDVFAYELLFKSDILHGADVQSETTKNAALEAVDSFLLNGLKILSGGKRVFVNFSKDMLLTEMPMMFPKDILGIGIHQDLHQDKIAANALRKLKDAGYTMLLNDCKLTEECMARALNFSDIVGGDFRGSQLKNKAAEFNQTLDHKIKFLAKSVETATDYEVARKAGYHYFQGEFFCKADLIPIRNIPSYKINFLKILKEINKPNVQFDQIENILKKDVSITYKLLRFINSANFGFKNTVESIRHALTLLGETELRKWLSLIILSGIGTNKPQELVNNTIVRAKFCEYIAAQLDRKKELSKFFLMGMFSMVDAFLDRPMDEILTELPLDDRVKAALLAQEDNRFRYVLDVVLDYERGDWVNFTRSARKLNLDENKIGRLYLEAVEWAA